MKTNRNNVQRLQKEGCVCVRACVFVCEVISVYCLLKMFVNVSNILSTFLNPERDS